MKKILLIGLCGAMLTGVFISDGVASVLQEALEAAWEADCDSKVRYQTPTDRPYITREVTIQGGAPDVMLAGELTMPKGPGPFPGVVLISGSELADRDSFILGHKTFLVLADYLTRRGYAVYRHDDRGYGKSTGDSYAALDEDFSADAAAALKWLRTQKGIDVNNVGYIGHSQGGFKGPLATQIEKPDFMIFLASGVESFGGLLLRQGRDIAKAAGASEEELQKQERDTKKILAIMQSSETTDQAKARLEKFVLELGVSKKMAKKLATEQATPWRMSEIKRNADLYADLDVKIASLIKAYDRPILSIYGGKDLIVSSDFNAPRTGPLLINKKSKVVVFPDMNHFMQTVPPGVENRRGIEEVCDIEMTFDPKALDTIGKWLDEVVR